MPPRRRTSKSIDTELVIAESFASLQLYQEQAKKLANVDAAITTARAGLVSNPKKWLISEPSLLDAIGLHAPDALRDCLLEFLGTISESRELVNATVLRLGLLGPPKSFDKIQQVLSVSDSKWDIVENLACLCDCTLDQHLRDSIEICEKLWIDPDRARIFRFLANIDIPDDLLGCWRDRGLQCLGTGLGDFYSVFSFLIKCCRSTESAKFHLKLNRLEESVCRQEQSKRARTTEGFQKIALDDCFRCLIQNKYALEAFRNCKSLTNPVFYLFNLLLFRISSEEKHVLQVLKDASQIDNVRLAAEFLLSETVHKVDLPLVMRIVRSCVQQGSLKIASLLMVQGFQSASQYDARDLISELAGYITDTKSSSWGLGLLEEIAMNSSELIYRYQSTLKIIFDHVDRLQSDQIRTYYRCMVRLAVYTLTQHGDASPWNDLLIIFRKQVGSLDSNIRLFGAQAVLAMSGVLFCSSPDLAEEATCSQAPRHIGNQRFLETFLVLFELSLSMVNCDAPSVQVICTELPSILSEADPMIIASLGRRISNIFESAFIFELKSSDKTEHNLDADEALIGVSFGHDSPQAASRVIMPYLFHLLQWSEKMTHHGSLDNIDALLGCPVKTDDSELHGIVLSNWLRVLVNAFADQDDKEIQNKCLSRLALLAQSKMDIPTVISGGRAENAMVREDFDNDFVHTLTSCKHVSGPPTAIKISSIPLSALVYCKYFAKFEAFLSKEFSNTNLSSWSIEDIEKVIEAVVGRLDVLVILCGELQRRSYVNLPEVCAKIIKGVDQFDSIVSLLQILIIGKTTSEEIISHGTEFIFSSECSTPEAVSICEKLSVIHTDVAGFIEHILEQLPNLSAWKKKLALHGVLCSSLSKTALTDPPTIEKATRIFEKLVQMSRAGIDTGFSEAILKYGRIFVERFVKECLPILQRSFISTRTLILETFKVLQLATRSLQIMCNHLKPQRLPKYRNLLPPMRRVLESLLYGVKQLLQANNCLSAFWIGNLKHRTIDGAEANSQVPLDVDSDEMSSQESLDSGEMNSQESLDSGETNPRRAVDPNETNLSASLNANPDRGPPRVPNSNKIPAIENLAITRDQYDTLDLTDNDIPRLENFPTLRRLRTLLVSNNKITRLDLEMMQKLPALEMLVLNNNPLGTVEALRVLQGGKLRYLSLIDCPVTRTPHYRLNVIAMLPQLKALDFCKITAAERQAAADLTTDTAVVEERPSKVSKVDREKIKERLRNAKSLDEIKQLERILDTGHLMELAGLSVACAIHAEYAAEQSCLVVCGPGNNGGDGLVAARHLAHFGYRVTVVYPRRLMAQCVDMGIDVCQDWPIRKSYDIVVDAIFGFSFHGPVREPYASLVQQLQSHHRVVSVDVPSGWEADAPPTNPVWMPAMLVSLTAPKQCCIYYKGIHYLGGRFIPPSLAANPSNVHFPILPDLGLAIMPHIKMIWLTDLVVQTPVLYTFVYIFIADPQPVLSICRIGNTLSIAYLLRCVSMVVTSLPDPRPGCVRITSKVFTTFTLHRCGGKSQGVMVSCVDCLFSGHMIMLTIIGLYWLSHQPSFYHQIAAILKKCTLLLFFAGIWAILANRTHYTIDILVAIYTGAGIWWSFAYFWQNHLAKRLVNVDRFYDKAF
ncbi:hypothetical protein PSACC_03619 [Paramicrosporidium saccamoebae]|uniref:NAD(P)H-hydrate epimerase n=1 Tax=Paramicrosporidium saccamoebae TaxID=1246581 RepID=A0A2H9TFQ1_9FUNG|nr:hypothetical protein PSACC_03619 [Paramicrosporidium saccamoebae]